MYGMCVCVRTKVERDIEKNERRLRERGRQKKKAIEKDKNVDRAGRNAEIG